MSGEGEHRQALKEWAVVEEALVRGRVSLLLRKGGISEKQGDFAVEHRAFWIFPSGWHQNPEDLASALHDLFGAVSPPPRGTVPFRVFCRVEEVFRVESTKALDRVEELHPLSPAAAHYRFHYRNRPLVHALLVRAYVLPEPVVLPDTHRYEGCVSWVELDRALPTDELSPALSDEAFAALRDEVRRRLG